MFWICPPSLDPACPFISKCVLHSPTTYQSGILGRWRRGGGEGGQGQPSTKWLIKLRSSFIVYEKKKLDYFIFEASIIEMYVFLLIIVVKQVSMCLNVYI